jgi:hypothetical protein
LQKAGFPALLPSFPSLVQGSGFPKFSLFHGEGMNLKTLDLKDNLYVVADDNAAPKFTHVEASLGWSNPAGEDHEALHALLVGGRQEDGRLRIFLEYQGDAAQLADMCVDVKDALLVERFWCDATAQGTVQQLRVHDGLTWYKSWGEDRLGNELWDVKEPEKVWRYFRASRPTAAIVPVPDYIRTDIQGGLDRLVRLAHKKQLIINKTCQICQWTLAQIRKDIEKHPIAQALIWLVWRLEDLAEQENRMHSRMEETGELPYPNREII